jgi:transcriptional regulator GlxA family with amidase domain
MPRIVLFAVEDALASSLALPIEMLRAAAQHGRAHGRRGDGFDVRVAAERRGRVTMSGALPLIADAAATQLRDADLAIVPSLWRAPHATIARHPRILAGIRQLASTGTRLCAIGTGSYFLAATGLLEGRRATTHWSFFDDFAQRYPAVRLQRRHLITRSGNFYCAGSVNSGADLMVHFIRELFGSAAARQVESQFSPEIRRPFEAHSFVEGETGAHPDEAIWLAQDWLLAHLAEPLQVPELAARSGLSTRSFNRRFRSALGTTPVRFLHSARIQAARELLRASNLAIGEIAARTGYADPSHFSRAFATQAGCSPQAYRRQVRGKLFGAAARPAG